MKIISVICYVEPCYTSGRGKYRLTVRKRIPAAKTEYPCYRFSFSVKDSQFQLRIPTVWRIFLPEQIERIWSYFHKVRRHRVGFIRIIRIAVIGYPVDFCWLQFFIRNSYEDITLSIKVDVTGLILLHRTACYDQIVRAVFKSAETYSGIIVSILTAYFKYVYACSAVSLYVYGTGVCVTVIHKKVLSACGTDVLIEGMTCIDLRKLSDLHAFLVKCKRKAGLMMLAVLSHIHLTAGMYYKRITVIIGTQKSAVKGVIYVTISYRWAAKPVPILIVFYCTYHFTVIVFIFVELTEENEVVFVSEVSTAIQRKLKWDYFFRQHFISISGIWVASSRHEFIIIDS